MNRTDSESDVTEQKYSKNPNPEVPGWGYRHQQCLILLICLTTAYSIRSCMGVALVAMTDLKQQANHLKHYNETEPMTRYVLKNESLGFWNSMMLTPPYPTFDWSSKVQDMMLSSFFWGYMVMQIPGGMITLRIGVKRTLTSTMMINSIICILLPWAAIYSNWILIVICRFLQGISQAFLFPGIHTFFGRWAPLHERSRLTAYVYGGQCIGVVTGTPLAGIIASSRMGWPGVFRVFGVITGIIGGLVWWLLADTPAQHPWISQSERHYIEREMGREKTGKNRTSIPWCAILMSPGMWAIVAAHCGVTVIHIFLYTEAPSYIDKIFKIDLQLNGLLVALPFLTMWITNFFFAWLIDQIICRQYLSVTNARKFAGCLGCIPGTILFIILYYVPSEIFVTESILILLGGFKICVHSGYQVNHIDISPNFAGPMMSISNFISSIFAALTPTMTSVILGADGKENEDCWKHIFLVLAAVLFVSNLIYVIFATAEIAPWNEVKDSTPNGDDNDEEVPMVHIANDLDATKVKEENAVGYIKVSINNS